MRSSDKKPVYWRLGKNYYTLGGLIEEPRCFRFRYFDALDRETIWTMFMVKYPHGFSVSGSVKLEKEK